ncbi:MAG: endonuclease V [Bacteroidota bacterium]
MLLAFDAHYHDTHSLLAAASFYDWTDPVPLAMHTWRFGPAAAYEPGQFYRRELPLILQALEDFPLAEIEAIVVDGYVYLDANGRLGLGGHLYHELQQAAPVIGVAKSYFRDTNAEAVLRGKSTKPLYVTSYGIPQKVSANHVRNMAGAFRMPDILGRVDRASKEVEP